MAKASTTQITRCATRDTPLGFGHFFVAKLVTKTIREKARIAQVLPGFFCSTISDALSQARFGSEGDIFDVDQI